LSPGFWEPLGFASPLASPAFGEVGFSSVGDLRPDFASSPFFVASAPPDLPLVPAGASQPALAWLELGASSGPHSAGPVGAGCASASSAESAQKRIATRPFFTHGAYANP
jgi:hypothetical protein